jgi:hypothetical protein
MEDIKVVITDGEKEVTVRNGQALPLREPVVLNVCANIQAPANWIEKRPVNPLLDNLVFSRSEMTIQYTKDENSYYGTKITGKLLINNDLKQFGILMENEKAVSKYTTEELASFLKANRYFFSDKNEAGKIISALNQFKAKLNTELEKTQDSRGNSKSLVEKVVDTNVPTEFTLEMPVFIGFEKKKFIVEICISTTDRSVTVWLESPELIEIIIEERDRIIDEEVSKFKLTGIPIIEK